MDENCSTLFPACTNFLKSIEGKYCILEEMNREKHELSLFAAIEHNPELFYYTPVGPFGCSKEMIESFLALHGTDNRFCYAVIDRATGNTVGTASFLCIRGAHAVVEIGSVLFSKQLQRSRVGTEAIYMMMRHAFDDLRFRRVEWKCDNNNSASKSAALRYGFKPEGLFRKHMIIKGRNRDTAWFSIVDDEWATLRAGYDKWLDMSNFDESGLQLRRLTECR